MHLKRTTGPLAEGPKVDGLASMGTLGQDPEKRNDESVADTWCRWRAGSVLVTEREFGDAAPRMVRD